MARRSFTLTHTDQDAQLVTTFAFILLLLPVTALGYAYALYPLLLWCFTAFRPRPAPAARDGEWPVITLTIPVYNEAGIMRATLEHVLALDYPSDRRHVLVISDASTDGTDDIATEFQDRGVGAIRLPTRAGKTAAENAAAAHLRGTIVVNVDATARPSRGSLKALVSAFKDASVGVASGRDISTGTGSEQTNGGESGYVSYEMWVRALETRAGSIVGASGCFYAIRRELYAGHFPEDLSRDFASALIAAEHGFRAVSVDAAVCAVPRAKSLDMEFHRKARTMRRGLATLWYKRHLLNPRKHGVFAVMLFSHKLCRWLVPLTLPFGALGLAMLASTWVLAGWIVGAGAAVLALSAVAKGRSGSSRILRGIALPSYLLMANAAGITAWWNALRQERHAVWEPTRRSA